MKSYVLLVIFICGFICDNTMAKCQLYPERNMASLSIRMAGRGRNSVPLYDIQANNAELSKVLGAILSKSGDQFLIDQDVRGVISLTLKKMPLSEILHYVEIAAKPPIHIERGKIIHVSKAVSLDSAVSAGVGGGIGGGLRGFAGSVGAHSNAIGNSAFGEVSAANRNMVNLDVPRDRPITLQQALQTMQDQSNVPISISGEIPRDVQFSGQITNTPVNIALEAIAKTAGLKVVSQHNGALMLTSANSFRLFINKVLIGSYPDHPLLLCTKCHYPLSPDWVVCPNCGQITPHGYELLEKANTMKKPSEGQTNR